MRINEQTITVIQKALIEAGFLYAQPTGEWDAQTMQSYRQFHAVRLCHDHSHTIQQPTLVSEVPKELLGDFSYDTEAEEVEEPKRFYEPAGFAPDRPRGIDGEHIDPAHEQIKPEAFDNPQPAMIVADGGVPVAFPFGGSSAIVDGVDLNSESPLDIQVAEGTATTNEDGTTVRTDRVLVKGAQVGELTQHTDGTIVTKQITVVDEKGNSAFDATEPSNITAVSSDTSAPAEPADKPAPVATPPVAKPAATTTQKHSGKKRH